MSDETDKKYRLYVYLPLSILLIIGILLMIVSRAYLNPSPDKTDRNVWQFAFVGFLVFLFSLKQVLRLGFKNIPFYRYEFLSLSVDRLLIICLIFMPVMIFEHHFLCDLFLVKEGVGQVSWLLIWPVENPYFVKWGLTIYFILFGFGLCIYEVFVVNKILQKEFLQLVARYAPIFIEVPFLIICILSFYWLYEIKLTNYEEDIATRIMIYIFDYNFSLILPFLCLLPPVIIISKTKKPQYSTDHFFNFYKILFIENPIVIPMVLILVLFPIAIIYFYPGDIEMASDESNRIEMWKLSIGAAKVLAPMILILPVFAKLIKNYERTVALHSYAKLRQIISSMTKPVIILGFGNLGRGVFKELKEREIVNAKEFSEIMTPTLDKRKVYKNLLIVEKDKSIFSNVFADIHYGNMGMVEPEIEQKGGKSKRNLFPQSGSQKECGKLDEEPVLIAGIAGEAIVTSIIYDKVKINDASLIISTVDYTATNRLAKLTHDKECRGIITVQDFHQLKRFLPSSTSKTEHSGNIIFFYNAYIEGVTLGRVVLSTAYRWLERNQFDREKLPKVLIAGGGKQIYYLTETYLLGLQQINMDQHLKDRTISILSNEEFYGKKVKEVESLTTRYNIKSGEWTEILESPSVGFSNKSFTWEVVLDEPDHMKTIRTILEKDKPHIIVITHKVADYAIKILETWITAIINLVEKDDRPTILVGTEGNEFENAKVKEYLEKYNEMLISPDKSFPIQKYDAMVRVYDDSVEQIGSIAEILINKEPISLYFCMWKRHGNLVGLCNGLAGLENKKKEGFAGNKKLSFQHIRIQNCPGKLGEPGKTSNRFLIESDIVLEEIVENAESDGNGEIVCEGGFLPNKFKGDKLFSSLIGDPKKRQCFDEKCVYLGLCNPKANNVVTEKQKESSLKNGKIIPFAKLSLCSDHYDVPGSIANVLNNLLFLNSRVSKKEGEVVNLKYIRSYSCFNQGMIKIELFGNVVTLKKEKNREEELETPCISYISICPITGKDEWKTYSENLKKFLNSSSSRSVSEPYNFVNNVEEPLDIYNIEIEHCEHEHTCAKTCHVAKRREELQTG